MSNLHFTEHIMIAEIGIESTFQILGGVYLNMDLQEGHLRIECYKDKDGYDAGLNSLSTINIPFDYNTDIIENVCLGFVDIIKNNLRGQDGFTENT